MPKLTPVLFISSTKEDLIAYRAAVRDAAIQAGFRVEAMEYWAAQGKMPPYPACMKKVEECDVLVAIVAHRYGWVPADQRRPAERASRGKYVLKVDVRKYFASIDHALLKRMLERVVKCRPTLGLSARIIDGSNEQEPAIAYYPGDDLFTPYERRRGLPLGNQTSQFFANVYLNGLDQMVNRELGPGVYARYVDDLVLFDDCKRFAHATTGPGRRLDPLGLLRCASEGKEVLAFVVDPGVDWPPELHEERSMAGLKRFSRLPNRTAFPRASRAPSRDREGAVSTTGW